MTPRIAIVEYGVSNMRSIFNATRLFAPETVISEDPEVIAHADALILPGQGAFGAGMEGLKVRGLIDTIRTAAARSTPILGICLGAQLLMEKGYEFGEFDGLGIIKGEVRHFPDLDPSVTIPNTGWRNVSPSDTASATQLFNGLPANPQFYFLHSYVLMPRDPGTVLASTTYGGYTYCAIVGSDSICGTQFHPEKSGPHGLRLLQNFIDAIPKRT